MASQRKSPVEGDLLTGEVCVIPDRARRDSSGEGGTLPLEAQQQRSFSCLAKLLAAASQTFSCLVQWGIAQMCLCEAQCQEGSLAPFWGSAYLPGKLSRDIGYRSNNIAISRDMGPLRLCLEPMWKQRRQNRPSSSSSSDPLLWLEGVNNRGAEWDMTSFPQPAPDSATAPRESFEEAVTIRTPRCARAGSPLTFLSTGRGQETCIYVHTHIEDRTNASLYTHTHMSVAPAHPKEMLHDIYPGWPRNRTGTGNRNRRNRFCRN